MYKIVKNKPMPEARAGKVKYPFAQMKVGDAFEVKDALPSSRVHNSVIASSRAYVKKYDAGAAFTTRVVDGSIWVWRTA
jgi:hypothetical protein